MASSTVVVDTEDLVRPVIRKILRMRSWVHTRSSDPSWARTRLSPPTRTPSPVEVEELNLLHVHHELVVPVVDQFDEQLAQRGAV